MPQASHLATVDPLPDTPATIAAVNAILRDPWVSARLAHDDRPPGHIDHPAVSYLAARVRGVLVGVFTCIRVSRIEVDLHVAVLRKALAHARDLGAACLAHIFTRNPAVLRATAYVVEGLETVCNYCRRLGFSHEGFRRDACVKGGRLLGVHIMGITRTDWRAAWAS